MKFSCFSIQLYDPRIGEKTTFTFIMKLCWKDWMFFKIFSYFFFVYSKNFSFFNFQLTFFIFFLLFDFIESFWKIFALSFLKKIREVFIYEILQYWFISFVVPWERYSVRDGEKRKSAIRKTKWLLKNNHILNV